MSNKRTIEVFVPDGVLEGECFIVEHPQTRDPLELTVPAGLIPGDVMYIDEEGRVQRGWNRVVRGWFA